MAQKSVRARTAQTAEERLATADSMASTLPLTEDAFFGHSVDSAKSRRIQELQQIAEAYFWAYVATHDYDVPIMALGARIVGFVNGNLQDKAQIGVARDIIVKMRQKCDYVNTTPTSVAQVAAVGWNTTP